MEKNCPWHKATSVLQKSIGFKFEDSSLPPCPSRRCWDLWMSCLFWHLYCSGNCYCCCYRWVNLYCLHAEVYMQFPSTDKAGASGSKANYQLHCIGQGRAKYYDLLATDKSWYFAIAEFNNCFIIWSPSLFFNLIFIYNCWQSCAYKTHCREQLFLAKQLCTVVRKSKIIHRQFFRRSHGGHLANEKEDKMYQMIIGDIWYACYFRVRYCLFKCRHILGANKHWVELQIDTSNKEVGKRVGFRLPLPQSSFTRLPSPEKSTY